jgi:FixJ family two-component response regulator
MNGDAQKVDCVVYIIDDDSVVREGIAGLLNSIGLSADVFSSTAEFLNSPRRNIPSCLILDVRLPGMSGLEFQEELANRNIIIPIIFISGHADIPMTVQAMKAGAVEFLTKPFREQDLLDAVRIALERDAARRRQESESTELQARYDLLTVRERAVLGLAVAGRRNKQIATELGISEFTVKMHRHNMMAKMGVKSLAELVTIVGRLHIQSSGER